MNITVIGTGYVGLVTGACFAEMGHTVVCIDVDKIKVERLKNGIIPIYEPGLEEIVVRNYKEGKLQFTDSLADGMSVSDILFIAVGTPPGEDGSADLKYVIDVATEIGKNLKHPTVIVDKSTVPVGTAAKVSAIISEELQKRNIDIEFEVTSNPEFLKEGAAVNDFMHPDRIIIGAETSFAKELMTELYAPFVRNHPRIMFMGVRDAEMTKYAANAMLATKISFMNEIANICEKMNVDVENVRLGIGADQRIGYHFIYAGCGYGGSCFPKDVKALISMASFNDFEPKLLQAVEDRNNAQKNILFEKVSERFEHKLKGKTFAIWGLAFKPGTDDMREAPSVILIKKLIAAGAKVKAFDPVAATAAISEFSAIDIESGNLIITEAQYEAAIDADALILVTEWKPFRRPDFKALKKLLLNPIIFDGRNQYDPKQLKQESWEYYGIGRSSL